MTALAAGHRPCAECRRADYDRLVELTGGLRADAIDERLHAERLRGRERRLHAARYDKLPDGAFVLEGGAPRLVLGGELLTWAPAGYTDRALRPEGAATVITPPSLLAILAAGWDPLVPLVHPSAAKAE